MNYSELTKQISENILKSVKQIIDQKSDSDKSFKAQITSVVSNDKYTIKHCGKTYAAHSSILCMVGNYVRVCAPCNNWSDLYIVENKSSRKILDDRLKEITNDISKANENFNRLQEQTNILGNRHTYQQMLAQGLIKEIEVAGDLNTYYPVAITTNPSSSYPWYPIHFQIGKVLGSKTANYPGNHSNGTSSCLYQYFMRTGGWDGNSCFMRTIIGNCGYATLISEVDMQGGSFPGVVVWMRGGGTTYYLACDLPTDVNIYYSRKNIANYSDDSPYAYIVAPRTDVGNGGNYSTSHTNWVGILA